MGPETARPSAEPAGRLRRFRRQYQFKPDAWQPESPAALCSVSVSERSLPASWRLGTSVTLIAGAFALYYLDHGSA
jgi:hypothetical protein